MPNLIADFNIWSNPSRNMKVDYETQSRTLNSVQVRFTFTYTMNGSSGYEGFSQYVTPTLNGATQSQVTLKGTSPSNWYGSPIVVTTGWYTVSQSWEKTSFSVSMKFTSADGDDSTVTKTGTVTFASYPAKSALSVSNGTMGTAQTLKITRYSTAFRDTITYSCGSASGTIATKTSSTSISWTPPVSLANQTPNSKTVSCRVTCTTYNGNTSIGSSYVDIVLTVPDNSDTRPTTAITTALVDGFAGKYLQNVSKVQVTQAGVAKYGASISAYAFTVDGKTYTGNGAMSNEIRTSGDTTIAAQVTDSRGYKGTATATITISAYSLPAVVPATGHTEVICERCDAQGNPSNTGAYLHLLAGGRFSSVDGENSITMAYSYRSMTGTFSSPVSYTPNTDLIVNLSLEASKAYEVKVDISDAVGESSSALYSIPAEVIPLHLGAGGHNVAVGGYCDYTQPDEFLCHWDARFKGNVIFENGGGGMPVGAITAYCGIAMPDGWLECNGQAVSRTTYANLFAVLGTTYGIGDGSTSFNVPDIRGRMIVGQNTSDADFDVLGETGGAKTHTHTTGNHKLTTSEIPAHRHNVEEANSTSFVITNARTHTSSGTYMTQLTKTGTYTASATAAYRLQTDNSGGSGGNHNHGDTGSASELSPYIVERYIIKV